jgi:hypothetical protein
MTSILLVSLTPAADALRTLGAVLIVTSLVALGGAVSGARERARNGGQAPTAQDLFYGPRRIGFREYGAAQWSPRVRTIALVVLTLGVIAVVSSLFA